MNSNDLKDIYEDDSELSPKRYDRFERISARFVLYLLSLNAVMVGFIMRLIINLTILAMVKEMPVDPSFNNTEMLCRNNNNGTHVQAVGYGGTLDWSLDQQYYVLTSFYWTYVFSQLIGGFLVQKYGTKVVVGWSMLIASTCNLCIPFASNIHYTLVVILQCMHGFVQGLTWSAIYAVIGVWIPINERSRFITCFQGSNLGTMLANLMAGYIIAKFSWIYVFYCAGGLGLLSSLIWYLLMYDKPEHHSRISQRELRYIQENREQCLHSQTKIPWMSIFTSIPVWVIGITAFGRMWVSSVMAVYGPLYLKTIIGVTVEMNGLLLGMSSFFGFLSAFVFSFVSDKIVEHKLMPRGRNRKIFTGISQIIPGILILSIGFVNCNIPLIITIWFSIQLFIAASFSGCMTNVVDVSPSYTGPVTSFVQTILMQSTVLSNLVVKSFLKNENIVEGWRHVFYISSGVIIGTYIFYAVFASGKVQVWDLEKSLNNLKENKVKKELLRE